MDFVQIPFNQFCFGKLVDSFQIYNGVTDVKTSWGRLVEEGGTDSKDILHTLTIVKQEKHLF